VGGRRLWTTLQPPPLQQQQHLHAQAPALLTRLTAPTMLAGRW
jgi:hypothetical protein